MAVLSDHDLKATGVGGGRGVQGACLVLLISKRRQACPSLSLDITNLAYQMEPLDALGRTQV